MTSSLGFCSLSPTFALGRNCKALSSLELFFQSETISFIFSLFQVFSKLFLGSDGLHFLIMLLFALLDQFSDLDVFVVRARHPCLHVRKLLQNFLSCLVLIVILDHLKVKLSSDHFNVGAQFLSEEVFFDHFSHFVAKVFSDCFLAFVFEKVGALVLLIRLVRRLVQIFHALIQVAKLVFHTYDVFCLFE